MALRFLDPPRPTLTVILVSLGALAALDLPAPRVHAESVDLEGGSITITTKNGSEDERRTRAQLERLLEEYDLEPFIHTRDVKVEASVIPHSHPVLTVNTKYLESDNHLLTTFVHEQLHWYAIARQKAVAAAIDEFRALFPEVPVRGGEGARDERSTYLHLIVCDLELQAMTSLVGEETARATLGEANHYRWIYRQVLENEKVREINARHGLTVP